jgi:hypothetical protein
LEAGHLVLTGHVLLQVSISSKEMLAQLASQLLHKLRWAAAACWTKLVAARPAVGGSFRTNRVDQWPRLDVPEFGSQHGSHSNLLQAGPTSSLAAAGAAAGSLFRPAKENAAAAVAAAAAVVVVDGADSVAETEDEGSLGQATHGM